MSRRGSRRSLLWQLHSFLGFWTLLLMLAWGVSGFQIGFPRVFGSVFGRGGPEEGGALVATLRFFRNEHIARYGEGLAWANWSWIIVSFAPTVLFISGVVVWVRRVVLRKAAAPRPGSAVAACT